MNKRTRKKWLKKQGLYVNPKETLDLDCNIAKYVLPRLKLFKKLNNGYPGIEGMETEEKWDEALDKMIWSFEQVANDYEIYMSINFKDSDWRDKCKDLNDKIREGLILFAKWFQYLGGEKMKEILGNNLEQFFFSLDCPKEYVMARTYKSDRYEVWSMPDEVFDIISDMSEEKFVKLAGEDAWWRSSTGSVLYSLDKGEITINNKKMIGWIRKPWDEEISKDINYQSLSEYLCEFIGVSTPNNVVACTMDLEKFNNMTMGQLFSKYEPVED